MRRFYIAGSFIAMLLICSIAPRSLEAGSGGKFEPAPGGKFTGQITLRLEFPSFLQAGGGTVASNDTIYDIPSCALRQYVAAAQTNIVVLKARSSNFNLDPNFAPLAGLYHPRQEATHASTWPYSLMPVPMDGQYHYQATYVREPHLPIELAFLCTDELGFVHPDVPPGTGEERTVHWDYRFGVTPKMDPYEALFTINRESGEPRIPSDGDQNLKTLDPWNHVMNTNAAYMPGWHERGLYYLEANNRDQEDYFRFVTYGTGRIYIELESGNGTYSNWDLTLRLTDDSNEVLATTKSGAASFSMQTEYFPVYEADEKDPGAGANHYRLQIAGVPKAKSQYSNVYYLPYRISIRFVPGWD